jgi:hypothetical protein
VNVKVVVFQSRGRINPFLHFLKQEPIRQDLKDSFESQKFLRYANIQVEMGGSLLLVGPLKEVLLEGGYSKLFGKGEECKCKCKCRTT